MEFGAEPQRDIQRLVTLGALAALAIMQIILNSAFWRAFQLPGLEALVFPVVGVIFTLIDMTGLGVVERLKAEGQARRARVWLALWAGCFLVNAAADYAGVATLVGVDAGARRERAFALHSAEQQAHDAARDVARLRTVLKESNLDLPLAALSAREEGLSTLMARRVRPTAGQVREQTQLRTALALAKARDDAALELSQARTIVARHKADADAPFASLAALAGIVGLKADSADAGIFMMAAITLLIKGLLTWGFWVNLQRPKRWVMPMPVEQGPLTAPPPPVSAEQRRAPTVSGPLRGRQITGPQRRRRPIASADGQ